MKVRHYMQRMSLCVGGLLAFTQGANAVEVHINSGNPAYPFPQFLDYTYGAKHKLGNLGTKNPEGVVHAEMEQDIRDAYQIHANEFAYTGESWGGYKYIETPYKSAYDCTEGDGYGLLAAAYMGDAVTFNGYWMCTHDKRRNRSKKYTDCTTIGDGYQYGPFAISDDAKGGGNTAADGDVDVALALYVAYKQWGEFMRDPDGNIVEDACGNPISYKQEMIEVIRGLVALSTKFATETTKMRVNSGLIGLDGYPKGGDTWNEQTTWAAENPTVFANSEMIYSLPDGNLVDVKGYPLVPEYGSGDKQHIDYDAPAYYREFWELFEQIQKETGISDFEIEQFKRGEASSDWMMGDMISKGPKAVPTAGWSEVNNDGSKTAYTNFNQGEDWRCSWRTIANYMWHGNPVNSWDPKSHKAVAGSNTYEYDAAVRLSKFLNNPIGWADGECMTYGDPAIPYSGPATTEWQYDPLTGATTDPAHFMVINWQNGTGTYAAVSAQDYDLLGSLYRQCVIEWDTKGGDDCYLGSVSNYMHGWARQMGMMVSTGNYPAPSSMNPMANMKIYRAIEDSVTYCYTGDQIKFLLDYRNYGSVDAKDVVIVENVPEDWIFVEASKGGVYDKAKHTVTWKIGTVPGFNSKDGVDPTMGQVWYSLKADNSASGRYCTTADITCSNGLGWTTNEYPNYKTATMQRNCVDVVARSLVIEKSVNRPKVNAGNQATFTIKFENSSEAGWIDGGRPRVNVSFANGMDGSRLQLMARLWNDAIEPYINYGNYRISYYMYDAGLNCYANGGDCPTGWGLSTEIYEGNKTIGSSEGIVVSHENIVEGKDELGKWNQRMCIQFAPLLVTTTMHVSRFFGGAACRIHKGGGSPMRGVWALFPSDYSTVDYTDDWSWSTKYNSEKDGLFFPVTPSWQKLDEKGKSIEEPVTKWLTCGCTESNLTVPNILVEEYDGYVWRRILGTGPMAGRDVDNVEIRDTLPVGLTFGEFVNECPLAEFDATWEVKKAGDREVIIWKIPKMQVKQKGSIIYTATADFPSGATCETDDEDIINAAWISGDKNSPVNDTAKITVTCSKVPEPIIPTTLVKTADKETYNVGDPITYTIEYEQTHGCIVEDATTMATDWKLSQWSLSDGKLTSGSTQNGTATFDYTLGQNLYMEYVCNPATYASYQVLLRQGAASPITLAIKSLTTSQMTVACYVGNKEVYAPQNITYGGGNPFTMRIDLYDDVLRLWINKDTTTGPILSIEDLPIGVGVAGFKNGGIDGSDNHGAHAISKLYTHSDYAYNLNIVDRKPEEIDFVSADNGGKLVGDSIVWKLVSGKDKPILPGEQFTVTWEGEVTACNESITNIAYAQLMGHKDNEIMAQAVTGCGAAACPLTKATLKADTTAFCENDSMRIKATAKDKGDYLYQWYDGKTKIGTETENLDTLWVDKKGSYWVKVTLADDATCTKNSDTLDMTVDAMPELVLADTSACAGGEIELPSVKTAAATYTYEWSDGSTEQTLTVNKDGEYSVAVTNGTCVAKDTATVKFGSVVLKGGIFTLNDIEYDRAVSDTGSICPNTKATLSVNYLADGNAYEWSSKPADPDMVSDGGNSITIAPKVMTTYYVKFKQECEAIDSFVVTIGGVKLSGGSFTLNKKEYPRSEGNTGSVCPDTENSLTVSYVSDNGEYEWSSDPADPAMVSNGATLTISPKATTTYFVDFTLGCAARDSFVVTLGEPMEISLENENLCDSVKVTASTEASSIATFHWLLDGELISDNKPYVVFGEDYMNGNITVYATADDACASEPEKVEFHITNMTSLVDGSPSVCPGKTTEIKVDATTTGMATTPTYTYKWLDAAGTPIAGATAATYEAGPGTYMAVVSNGVCTDTLTHSIVEGNGELSGYIYVGDSTLKGTNKTYGYCGKDGLTVKTDYVKTDGDYTWTVLDAAGQPTATTFTGASVDLNPTEDMTILLSFTNECDAYDTLRIKMLQPVTFAIDSIKECETTTLKISSELSNIHYYWTYTDAAGAGTYEGKNFDKTIADFPTALGTASFTAKAEGYCSVDTTVSFGIDTLGVSLTGDERVCVNGVASLEATATASNPKATITYSYGYRKAGSFTAFTPLSGTSAKQASGPLTEDTEFEVTATSGSCEAKATFTVKVSNILRDGILSIDGSGILSKDANGTKVYRTCGDKGSLELAVTHTGEDFVWTKDGEKVGDGASVTITPSTGENHTEQYVVNFTNQCSASDTIIIGVYPLSVEADWSAFSGEYCEGEDAHATLNIVNYDGTLEGSFIKWYKDGVEEPDLNGKTELDFTNMKYTQSGSYHYMVSNGVCTRPDAVDAGSLLVKRKVGVGTLHDTVTAPRGDDAEIQILTMPEDALVEWYEETEDGREGLTIANPLTLTAARDYKLTAVVNAAGYCSDSIEVTLLADAYVAMNFTHTTAGVCKGGGLDTLRIDTAGTGKVLFPEKYSISVQVSTDSIHFNEVARNVDSLVIDVQQTSYFRTVITYGKQKVYSDTLKVRAYDDATFRLDYDQKVCENGAANIRIKNLEPKDAMIVWLPDPTLQATDSVAVATPASSQSYGFYIVQNNWLCTQQVLMDIEAVPQLILLPVDTTICEGGSATLRMLVANGDATFCSWYEGDELISEKSKQLVKPTETTVYTFKTSNGYCDTISAEVNVMVAESPVIVDIIDMGKKETKVVGEGGVAPYEYAIYPNDYGTSEILTADKYGVNKYLIRDMNGCVGSRLDTLVAPKVVIPEVITPNGDGIKDFFEVPALSEAYPNSRVKIFDRWGKILAEFDASEGGWDGTYNGKRMPSADYWYEIYVPELYKYYTGHFTLLNDQ